MASPLTGQLALSGTAQPLSTPVTVTAWTLKASLGNKASAYIGNSTVTTGTGYELSPGETFEYELIDQNGRARYSHGPGDVYVVGTSGDSISWFASR